MEKKTEMEQTQLTQEIPGFEVMVEHTLESPDVFTFNTSEQDIEKFKEQTQLVEIFVMGIWTGVRIRGDYPAVRMYLTENLDKVVVELK